MTPFEYELFVKRYFERITGEKINVEHRSDFNTPEGSFNIDLNFRFRVANLDYLTIIECKHSKNRIERSVVMELNSRKTSLKAHKAILVTTVGFQSGALKYALQNGIGLIKLTTDGEEEILSHFKGNYKMYLERLVETSTLTDDLKLKSSIGIISPSESLNTYFLRKFEIDIKIVEENIHNPKKLFHQNYLPGVPVNWDDEYEKLETCGLDLVLENEQEIRLIKTLQYYYMNGIGP